MARKYQVPVRHAASKAIDVESGATRGATFGVDLLNADGSVLTAGELAALLGVTAGEAGDTNPIANTIWSRVFEKPPNIVSVAALASSGLVVRQAAGDWLTRDIAVADTGRLTVSNADGESGNPTLDMADIAALSVWGRAGNTSGKPAAIAAAANDRILRRVSDTIDFGQLTAGMVPNNLITDAMLRDSVALSVLGRAANTGGDPADIAAGADDRVLARVSSTLAFTQLTAGMFPAAVVPDAALSANVPLLDASNIFTAIQQLVAADAFWAFNESDAAADEKIWLFGAGDSNFRIATRSGSSGSGGAGVNALVINRTGTAVDEIELNATLLDFNGAVEIGGNLLVDDGGAISEINVHGTGQGRLYLAATGGAADEGSWLFLGASGALQLATRNDADSAGSFFMDVRRTGTVVDSVTLSGTVIELDGAVDFAGSLTVASNLILNEAASSGVDGSLRIVSSSPGIEYSETDAAANEKQWLIYCGGGELRFRAYNDAGNAANEFLTVSRTGNVVDAFTLSTDLVLNDELFLTGLKSPAALTNGNNDNWNPGIAGITRLRATGGGAGTTIITGLVGGTDGKIIIITNAGADGITIANESGSSTASNRFRCNGNKSVAQQNSIMFIYDGTLARWSLLGHPN